MPNFKYFHVFGSKCYILEDREKRRKMDPNSEEGIYLGYSTNNRVYIVYNKCSKVMMESINMVIYDTPEDKEEKEDEVPPQQTDVPVDVPSKESNIVPEITNFDDLQTNKGLSIRVQKDHPLENIIGNMNEGVVTISRESIVNLCFISKIEPKNVKEVLIDELWINVMQ